MFYELATLSMGRKGMASAPQAVRDYVSTPEAEGRLLGLWRTVAGRIDQLVVFREFDARPNLAAERERARRSSNPFNCSGILTALDMTSFVPFDFFPPIQAGAHGPLYQLCTYYLKPAGLAPMEVRWRSYGEQVRAAPNPIIAMYAMDGAPRIVEICSVGSIADMAWRDGETCSRPGLSDQDDEWMIPEMTLSLLAPQEHSLLC